MTDRPKRRGEDLPPGVFRRGDRYRVIVYAGIDPVTGKQRRVTSTADTPREAVKVRGKKCQRCWARMRAGLPALRDGEPYTTSRPGLRRRCGAPRANGQPCQKWTRYQSGRCERHGGLPADPKPDRVHKGDCVAGLPMQASSVRRVHSILSAALAGAPRKLLDHNPAAAASPPKLRKSEIRPPDHRDVARLLATAAERDPEWAVWLRLDAMTGARRGELCAIRINKLDWSTGELRMDRNIIHAKDARGRDRLLDRPTKADTVKRPVLDSETLRLVRELIRRKKGDALRCGVRLWRDAYLFSADPEGRRPVRPQLMTKRFMAARDRLGLQGVRLHDLRHWAATSMLAAGVPVQTAAGRLGNDPRTMLRVYSHFLPGEDREAGELLAGLVDGPWLPEVDEDEEAGS